MAQQSIISTGEWDDSFAPLIKKYKGKKHPLDYKNVYELLVAVILSAQDSDKHINEISQKFFTTFPNMESLAKADSQTLFSLIGKVRNFGNKTKWLMELAQRVKTNKNIPISIEELVKLPGIGRKSANVIMREAGVKAEGIIVDLHVVRVAPRLGVASGADPKKIETQLMNSVSEKHWGDVGMAISFLGREICRPTNPKCSECPMNGPCAYNKM